MSTDERVCFDKEGFVLFMDSLRDAFGSAGESMVFHMSKQYGKYIIESAKTQYDGPPSEYNVTMNRHLDKVRSLGWGEMSFDKMDWVNGVFDISMKNNTFLDYCKDGKEGMCFFLKGVMTGTVEEITGQRFTITETECIRRGDAKCSFQLKKID